MNKIPHLTIPTFPETMDNTVASTFASCPRKAFLGHFLHLKRKTKSVHLEMGKAYAGALEVYRRHFYNEHLPTYKDHDECLHLAVREFLTLAGYDPELESSEAWQKTPKTPERMLEMLFDHFTQRPPLTDPIQPLIIEGIPAVEKSFTMDLDFPHPDTGDSILFHGRFDMLATWSGQIFVFDDKTCSSLGPQWVKQWDFRSQFTGYVLGAQTFDLPIAGAIVRGHCILQAQFKFADAITYRKKFQLDNWWHDIHGLMFAMIQMYQRAKEMSDDPLEMRHAFPTAGTFSDACNSYGGCPYRELCESPHPQRWLSQYEVRKWDPKNPN